MAVVPVASLGVVVGTLAGTRVLGRLPEKTFRRVLAIFLLLLGIYMIAASGR